MEEFKEEVTVLVGVGSPKKSRREDPRARAAKNSESRKEE